MSQEYYPPRSKGKGKGKGRGKGNNNRQPQVDGEGESSNPAQDFQDPQNSEDYAPEDSQRPGYMTVGSGSTSHHATRLQHLIDDDSGYGSLPGSVAGDDFRGPAGSSSSSSSKFPLGSPRTDPTVTGGDMSMQLRQSADPRGQDAAIHQLWYNKHRVTLARAINQVVDLLEGLREMNVT